LARDRGGGAAQRAWGAHKRREEQKAEVSEEASRIQAERRRRRYPVPWDDLPPLGVPLTTASWGVVVFEAIDVDPLDEPPAAGLYPHVQDNVSRYVWAHWRMPTLQEIYRTRPHRSEEEPGIGSSRGWWWASGEELQERARKLREVERAQRSRQMARQPAGGM